MPDGGRAAARLAPWCALLCAALWPGCVVAQNYSWTVANCSAIDGVADATAPTYCCLKMCGTCGGSGCSARRARHHAPPGPSQVILLQATQWQGRAARCTRGPHENALARVGRQGSRNARAARCRPGGDVSCCHSTIKNSDRECSSQPPPCFYTPPPPPKSALAQASAVTPSALRSLVSGSGRANATAGVRAELFVQLRTPSSKARAQAPRGRPNKLRSCHGNLGSIAPQAVQTTCALTRVRGARRR